MSESSRTASSRHPGESDVFPSISASSSSTSQAASFSTKRSLTPRGPLFTNLDEAHRKITSRLGANNPFKDPLNQDGMAKSVSSSAKIGSSTVEQTIAQLPLPQTERRATPAHDSTEPFVEFGNASSDLDIPRGTELKVPGHLQMNGLGSCQSVHPKGLAEINHRSAHTSRNTVEQIYDQYGASDHGGPSSPSSLEQAYTFSSQPQGWKTNPFLNQGDEELPSLHPEVPQAPRSRKEARRAKEYWRNESPGAPQLETSSHDLKRLPSPRGENSSVLPSDPEAAASHQPSVFESLRSDAAQDTDTVSPLRLSPMRAFSKRRLNPFADHSEHRDTPSDPDSSMTDRDTPSTDDPFKYDGVDYQEFLRPAQERNVSQVLHQINQETLASLQRSSPRKDFHKLQSQTGDHVDIESVRNRTARPEGNFFDPSAIMSFAQGNDESHDIKVVIQCAPQDKSDEARDTVGHMKFRTPPSAGHHRKVPKDSSSECDWVTEATSDVGTDLPPASGVVHNHDGVKATGSSIADYSDEDEDDAAACGYFNLRHTTSHYAVGHGQPTHHQLGPGHIEQSVFVSKPQEYEWNKNLKNSRRMVSNERNGHHFSSRLSANNRNNPFRQGIYQRPDDESKFPYDTIKKGPSKYDFRDSLSEYAPAIQSNEATHGTYLASTHSELPHLQPDISKHATAISPKNEFRARPPPLHLNEPATRSGHQNNREYQLKLGGSLPESMRNIDDERFLANAMSGSFENEPCSAMSKFSFELISLDQAQAKHKEQRKSGQTESPVTRDKKSKSVASSQPSIPSPKQPSVSIYGHRARRDGSHHVPWMNDGFQGTSITSTYFSQSGFSPTSNASRSLLRFSTADNSTAHSKPSMCLPTLPANGRVNDPRRPRKPFIRLPVRTQCADESRQRYENGIQRYDVQLDAQNNEDVSPQANARRRTWFLAMALLSIVPFFAPLVLLGYLDDSLAWLTRGEVSRLTRRQRRFIKWILIAEVICYTAIVAGVVVYHVTKFKTSHSK